MYFILFAAILWGTTGTAQILAPADATPVSVGAARIVIGGLLLLVVAGPGLPRLLAGGRTTWLLMAAGAVAVAAYQTAFFASVSATGVATGTVVTIGSGPVFAGLLAWLIRQGRPDRRWLVSTVGAVAGCATLVGGGEAAGVRPTGVALALLAGFGYASYATVAAYLIGRGEDDRAVVAGLFGGAGILLLPVLIGSPTDWLTTGEGLLLAGYLGAVTTTVGYLLYGRGLRTTSAAAATTLTIAEPAVAAVLGFLVLRERLTVTGVVGLVLVAVSLGLLVAPGRSQGSVSGVTGP